MMYGDALHLVTGITRARSRRSLGCAGLAFALVGAHPVAGRQAAQPVTTSTQITSAQGRRPYMLSVNSANGLIFLSLKAEGARLSEIAAELEKRLGGTRVVLGPTVKQETVSVNVSESLLEQALLSFGLRVFVDYEIRQNAGPVPLGIHLLGPTDPAPDSGAVVRGISQAVVIEGHTEEVETSPKDDPLKVIGDRRFLTISSTKQPLAVVARAIGDVLGIPVDVMRDATELVDANIVNAVPEDAIPTLSPNLRLYVRVDLNLAERTPLKLAVGRPAGR